MQVLKTFDIYQDKNQHYLHPATLQNKCSSSNQFKDENFNSFCTSNTAKKLRYFS